MQTRPNIDPPAGLADLLPIQNDNLIPQQQPTPLKLLKSSDCYICHGLKYPDVGYYHSYAEFIHALLLEADPSVVSFVPQPYLLRLAGRLYTPDAYVFSQEGVRILELKPRGEFDEQARATLVEFFQRSNMTFEVISNEHVLESESLALNWLPIVQVLVQANKLGLETFKQEQQILDKCLEYQTVYVGDILSPAQRDSQALMEIALNRLLHQHRLEADLRLSPLDFGTELRRCI